MRLGHNELITLLNFCSGKQDIQSTRQACPNFWKEISFVGRVSARLGLSECSFWKRRFVFDFLIPETVPYLSVIFSRSFIQRDEHQLELIWDAVLSCCQINQEFKSRLIEEVPQFDDLSHLPFPRFSFIRRAHQKTKQRRAIQAIGWNEQENLYEYELRLARLFGKREQELKDDVDDSVSIERSSTPLILKQFRTLQVKTSQIEKSISRSRDDFKKMDKDSIIIRFEDEGLFFSIQHLLEEFRGLQASIATLHLDLQEWEVCGYLKDDQKTELMLSCWDVRIYDISSLLDSVLLKKKELYVKLEKIFAHARHRIESLVQEADAWSQKMKSHPNKELAVQQIRKSKDLLFFYEKCLMSAPGPSYLLCDIEDIVVKNLKFVERLAQNPVTK